MSWDGPIHAMEPGAYARLGGGDKHEIFFAKSAS